MSWVKVFKGHDQGSVVKGLRSVVKCHWSEVRGHRSESRVRGHRLESRVSGQRSLVRVKGHWSGLGSWSRVSGQGS